MDNNQYEIHDYKNPDLPVVFHLDTHPKEHPYRLHWHEHIEILYCIAGKGYVSINEFTFQFNISDIIIVPSQALHQIVAITDEISYYVLAVDYNYCIENGFDLSEIIFKTKIRSQTVNSLYDKIINEYKKEESFYEKEIMALIHLMLVHLMRHYVDVSATLSGGSVETIKKIFSYVEKNYSKNISSSTLAKLTGYSPHYFCYIFKKYTNMTPNNYINSVRCRHAKKMIKDTTLPISKIALSCGFNNLSYFSKTYKKHMGILPSVVRNTSE